MNASVTIGVYIIEWRHWKRNMPIAITCIISQLLGGYAACCLKGLLTGWPNLAKLAPTDVGVYRTIWHIYLEETFFTFLFVSVILHSKYANTAGSKDAILNGIAISLTLFAVVLMASDQTGACLNPTIGTTFLTMEYAVDKDLADKLIHLLIAYVFGPLTGGIVAALWLVLVGF